MKRRRPPVVESLESKTLLSGLSYTLTTNQPVYQAGQPIQITFTETNTSNQPVTVNVDPTDFTVSQDSFAIWQSDPGTPQRHPSRRRLSRDSL